MVFSLYTLKNEFKRYVGESRSYGLDYFTSQIGNIFYLIGIIMAVYLSNTSFKLSNIVRLISWYMLFNSSFNAVYDAEFEIRSDFFKNLSYARVSIWQTYLNRFLVYSLEGLVIFLVSLGIVKVFTGFKLVNDLALGKLLTFVFLATILNLIIYFSLIALTFIFERTSTFTSLVMTFIVFLSGMILDFNNIFSNLIIGRVARSLTGPVSGLTFALVLVLFLPFFIFVKYADNHIYK